MSTVPKQPPVQRGEDPFEVFARRGPADSLTHVGTVRAPNEELAIVRARVTYDERAWTEMCICRRDTVVRIDGKATRGHMGVN
jgi:1,2-phenylacetyl-CoA epoxidase PaaB subunit